MSSTNNYTNHIWCQYYMKWRVEPNYTDNTFDISMSTLLSTHSSTISVIGMGCSQLWINKRIQVYLTHIGAYSSCRIANHFMFAMSFTLFRIRSNHNVSVPRIGYFRWSSYQTIAKLNALYYITLLLIYHLT